MERGRDPTPNVAEPYSKGAENRELRAKAPREAGTHTESGEGRKGEQPTRPSAGRGGGEGSRAPGEGPMGSPNAWEGGGGGGGE